MIHAFSRWPSHDSQYRHTDSRRPFADVDGVTDSVYGPDYIQQKCCKVQ